MNSNVEELASLYVLDELNAEERRAFDVRLDSDTGLLLMVRELEIALEDQIRNLPQQPAPEQLFEQIKRQITPVTPVTAPTRSVITISWASFAGWGMAAALILGVGLTLLVTSRESTVVVPNHQAVVLVVSMDSDSAFVEAVPAIMAVDELENFVQLAEMAETYWEHPEQLPGSVQSPLANTLGSGYAVFDPQSKRGFIAIQNLTLHEKGKNYFLWLRDSGSNVLECAGIIPMQGKDQGLYFFELEEQSTISSNHVAFFITEEEASDTLLSQPKGELVLGSDHI